MLKFPDYMRQIEEAVDEFGSLDDSDSQMWRMHSLQMFGTTVRHPGILLVMGDIPYFMYVYKDKETFVVLAQLLVFVEHVTPLAMISVRGDDALSALEQAEELLFESEGYSNFMYLANTSKEDIN